VEELRVDESAAKSTKYRELIPQIRALIEGEKDAVANMANLAAAIHQTFGHLWVGFYLLKEGRLVLGPFQGPIACTRIELGKGVCGTAAASRESVIVEDVNQFPGHIACSPDSRSEIVIPISGSDDQLIGVLDIDSSSLAQFDEEDDRFLKEILEVLKLQQGW
jgi:L-methionine (R)-S-oxide reductase